MSLAADTREAVRKRPFLFDALRAGLLNYSAAATWLVDDADLDGDPDAVATALRRFREDLPSYGTEGRTATVSMRSGVGVVDEPEASGEDPLLRVGGKCVRSGGRDTAVLANGDVDATTLATVLRRLSAVDVGVSAAGVAGDAFVVVVPRRDGATTVRVVEATLDAVPDRGD